MLEIDRTILTPQKIFISSGYIENSKLFAVLLAIIPFYLLFG
jgi:hypothetical protein